MAASHWELLLLYVDYKGMESVSDIANFFCSRCGCRYVEGLIHVKLRVRDLLSGIIMMTALYTVNLRIAGRQICQSTIWKISSITNWSMLLSRESLSQFKTVIVAFVITMIVKYILDWYLSTKSGFYAARGRR